VEPGRAAAVLADFGALTALANPVRRRLYELVADAGRAIGRDEAAAEIGVSRSLAAYHLDKLVERGLLEACFERRGGGSGPGAGRPAKLYRRARREFALRAPPRDYQLLSELLLRAGGDEQSDTATARLERVAYEFGGELAEAEKQQSGADPKLEVLLRARGYEPFDDEPGTVRLRNCPFDAAANRHPDLVCRLNLGLLGGILDGLGRRDAHALLEPGDGICCVAIRTTAGSGRA
jgi:predicted ArsR family transcriptional regulator